MINNNTISLGNFLKGQFVDFVDNYKNYFLKTLGISLALTIICFTGAALFQRFSTFDVQTMSKPISIIDNFFNRFSNIDTYSLVDLTKTLFLFLIAIFSIGLTRLSIEQNENKKLSFDNFISKIKFKDFVILFVVLCTASTIDFALVKLDSQIFIRQIFGYSTEHYIRYSIFQLRIYIPLILFAIPIYFLTKTKNTKLTWKRVLYLYISVWLFNEFAYEISMWVRSHIIGLILLPVDDQYRFYLFESILGIPLIALFFLGYHSAMTFPFIHAEENEIEEVESLEV